MKWELEFTHSLREGEREGWVTEESVPRSSMQAVASRSESHRPPSASGEATLGDDEAAPRLLAAVTACSRGRRDLGGRQTGTLGGRRTPPPP